MKRHLMLDIETLGNVPNSIIISISAVVFDDNFKELDYFNENLSIRESDSYGFYRTESTLQWWREQSEQAFKISTTNQQPVNYVLTQLASFIESNNIDFVYGNSVSFDCVLLNCYFDRLQIERPWKFWQERCFRTYKNTFNFSNVEFKGIPHFSLDDCRFQIEQLKNICLENNIKL